MIPRAVLALALVAAPAMAQPAAQDTPATAAATDQSTHSAQPRAPLPAALVAFRAQDARVLWLGFRLATSNVDFCEDVTASAGMLLHDMASYGEGDKLRDLLRLEGDVGVQALVPDGPAMRAGLRVDDTVTAIGDLRIADIPMAGARPWARIEAVRAETERVLAETGTISVAVLRDGVPMSFDIVGAPACRSRFEIGEGSSAVADGHQVVIGPDFAGIDYPDPLLAAVLAHEFAHNVLKHRAWFDANGGRQQKTVRLTEREADRLMPWLLVNAGFEPSAASAFMETWGPRHGGWIFRKRTHDGWDERRDFIEAEFPLIESLVAETGKADWAEHFRREDMPSD